jgi:PAS domain S-box-containing protein
MGLMPSLSVLRVWPQNPPLGGARATRPRVAALADDGAGTQAFPSTALPTPNECRFALAVVLASLALFAIAVPFARQPLAQVWAFIPIYESALATNELITATLLFTQFLILRSRALLVLACGYALTAGLAIAHGLTFPGLFSPTGLLGAGPQTTAWLYMFWHMGLPLSVIAYACLGEKNDNDTPRLSVRSEAFCGIGAVCAAVVGPTMLATTGHDFLPLIMRGNTYTPTMTAVVSTVWLLTLVALLMVWKRPRRSTMDLWLMVSMCAWFFDIALSAVLNGGRFDLGFYAGRAYGLLAANFVLIMLMTKTGALYASLSRLLGTEQLERRRESAMRRRIFDTSLDLIFVADRQGNLMEVSPSSQSILGYNPNEMIGHCATEFLYPDDLENTRNEMRLANRDKLTHLFDCRYIHKDGRVVSLSWKGVWSDPDRQYFFIGRDMTERIKLEQQLRHSQKMEAIGQLTGGIAHDFNNILAVIIGMAELTAARVAGDPTVLAMVKQIDESAERGAQLVQRMLAFARKQPLETHVLNVNETVNRVVTMLERMLGENITLKAVLDNGLWSALADPSQLEDAIVNLAINARDAMPIGGRLLIETANVHLDEDYAARNLEVSAGDYVAIIVTDTGTGIPPDIIERVFEPFFTTKNVGKGTGLGLSMVYGFVKQSQGHVKIYSEIGHGTSIRLYFPKATKQTASKMLISTASCELTSGGETILVVEDDDAVRKMAVCILGGLGYHVRQASDGKSALNILHTSDHIDLLFTDMVMSNGVSGQDLVQAARQIRPTMRTLLTSGYSEQFINARVDAQQDVPLLGKPYRKESLATAIRSALNGTRPQ